MAVGFWVALLGWQGVLVCERSVGFEGGCVVRVCCLCGVAGGSLVVLWVLRGDQVLQHAVVVVGGNIVLYLGGTFREGANLNRCYQVGTPSRGPHTTRRHLEVETSVISR